MDVQSVACNLTVIRACDLDRSENFYRALGVRFVRHSHGRGPLHLASETEGHVFEIYPIAENDLPTRSARTGFAVSSVDDVYKQLISAGGEVLSSLKDSPWGRRAVVVDPDGHRVELTARDPA